MPDVFNHEKNKELDKTIAKSSVLQKAKHTKNSAFRLLPVGFQFDVQHSEEKILLLMRQHFITNTGWIVMCVFLALLPTVLPIFPFFSFLPLSFRLIIQITWYFLVAGYALERFIIWYYNVYIITNERIVDVDFYSLLFKRVSEAKLDRIEDITSASGGVVQSFFDYGTVMVQTAGEVPEIEFENVPHPDLVSKLVSELTEKEEPRKKR
jgi:hypothetical protein